MYDTGPPSYMSSKKRKRKILRAGRTLQQPGQASGGIFPKSQVRWLLVTEVSRNKALCSSEGQRDFRLRRLDSLLDLLFDSLIAEDLNMTWDPMQNHNPAR
ncbi:hypothetical protein TNCV_1977661 [Trichonephila clavipes]|nr:hypothetical protein TNCV_1977661 [Trichonephila clavipes]